MEDKYYPWDGNFVRINDENPVAVVLLNTDYKPNVEVAAYGHLKTENIGIEKIVANVISNPNIRYLIICGKEIRGHKSGRSLVSLNKNGIDKNNRIIDAPGAIPYIENLKNEAIERFRKQTTLINLINKNNFKGIKKTIEKYSKKQIKPFGEPYIAIKISKKTSFKNEDKRALHSKIQINYMGKIKKRQG
ncbi:MAG: hypothetical protein V5A68_03830 [Candidatus Thermoplasmatota archaeon]